VITVVSGAESIPGREAPIVLRSAEKAASTEGLRQRASRHCDYSEGNWQCSFEGPVDSWKATLGRGPLPNMLRRYFGGV
jgi:hypothetical protein